MTVGPAPLNVAPAREAARPSRARAAARAALRAALALPVVLAATLAGIGWLYLLRRTGALAVGPRLVEALPLQRLAGGAAQPVGRVVAAWLPAGIFAGLALRAAGWTGRGARAAIAGAGSFALLVAAGAAADAITANEPLAQHWAAQPQRAATLLAAALVAIGAALVRAPARRAHDRLWRRR